MRIGKKEILNHEQITDAVREFLDKGGHITIVPAPKSEEWERKKFYKMKGGAYEDVSDGI